MKSAFLVLCLLLSAFVYATEEKPVDAPAANPLLTDTINVWGLKDCYVRIYDADHLKRNSRQKVKLIGLMISKSKIPFDPRHQNQTYELELSYVSRLGSEEISETLICETKSEDRSTALCYLDGDAGQVEMQFRFNTSRNLYYLNLKNLSTQFLGHTGENFHIDPMSCPQ